MTQDNDNWDEFIVFLLIALLALAGLIGALCYAGWLAIRWLYGHIL